MAGIGITFTWEGLDGLMSNTKQLIERIPNKADERVAAVGRDTLDKQSSLTPVRTGHTRSCGYVHIGHLEFEHGNTSPVAPFLEWGTRKMRARPFVTPAFAWAGGEVMNRLSGLLEE